MCELLDPARVTVCDVVVDRYREVLARRLGEAVSFTHVDNQPTLVECHDTSKLGEFSALVRELMGEVR